MVHIAAEEFEVDIRITSFSNTRAFGGRYGQHMGKPQQASRGLIQRWTERSALGELRWVRTRFPTSASAQDAEMIMPEYTDYFYCSCFTNQDDLVSAWEQILYEGQAIVENLSGK